MPAEWFEKRDDGWFHLVHHPSWGLLKPQEPGFDGKVIVLENGGSFSTTAEFLAKLKDLGRATIVGEESGGAFSGDTSGPSALLVLPNSHIQVPIHLLGYYMSVGHQQSGRRGILPDIPVRYTIDDILHGRDRDMLKALEIARHGTRSAAAH